MFLFIVINRVRFPFKPKFSQALFNRLDCSFYCEDHVQFHNYDITDFFPLLCL